MLVERGYPAAAGLTAAELAARLAPLRPAAAPCGGEFVLVVRSGLVPSAVAIGLVRRRGRAGFLSLLEPAELATFDPIEGVPVPDGDAYLVLDANAGADLRDVTPDDALALLRERARSPLTIEEGIAVATQFPELVAPGAGFSLAGSRCGDKRVTALWISKGAPKLGWCWAGNPHTWLGTASCDARAGLYGRL